MSSLQEVEKIVSHPYISQAKHQLVVVKTLADAAALSKTLSESVPVALPLKTIYKNSQPCARLLPNRILSYRHIKK